MTSKPSKDSVWPKIAKTAATLQRKGERVTVTPGNTPVIESPNAIVTRAHGPLAQVTQTNMLSTPVLVVIIVGLSLCFGLAFASFYVSQIGEREARLAQYEVQQLKDSMRK